jgi:hypothetical protein
MPGVGKTAQSITATRRLKDSLHASIMTIVPRLCNERPQRVEPRNPCQRMCSTRYRKLSSILLNCGWMTRYSYDRSRLGRRPPIYWMCPRLSQD